MSTLPAIGRMFLLIGVMFLLVGGLFLLFGRLPWFGHLPGDIAYEGRHFRFYFPLTTCLLVSLLATLLFSLARLFLGR